MSEELGVYWWRMQNGRENFGDALGPCILNRLGYKVRRVAVDDAELVTCGSILEHLTNPCTAIWGSGMMYSRPLRMKPLDVRAARGSITSDLLGVDVPLGDPGLLVSALWKRSSVRHRIGVVPHYMDDRHWPWADLWIDVLRPVDEVIAEIGSCAVIAASSLHGLIVADSFGIPTIRLGHDRTGGSTPDLKYVDYATALCRPIPTVQEELVTALGQ